jgi:hypothetical protein
MSQFLKGLAITVGVGLGCTAGSLGKASPRRNRAETQVPSPGEEPFIASAIAPPERTDSVPALLSGVESRLQEQEAQFRILRARATETEKRSVTALELVKENLQQLRQGAQSVVEKVVTERMAAMESRLQAEAQESWTRSRAALEQAVERKVADRIGSLEQTMADQTESIGALRTHAEDTDKNLQRLIAAVERLCENTAGQPLQNAAPPPLPPPVPPIDGPPAGKMFTPESRRPRVPMARIL